MSTKQTHSANDAVELAEAIEAFAAVDHVSAEALEKHLRAYAAQASEVVTLAGVAAGEIFRLRAANRTLHRRAQKAEGEAQRLRNASGGGSWGSPERVREAKERDAQMDAVAKAEARRTR